MLKNFRVGDKAVYPAQGVAEVLGIESREVSGNQETFYMLRLLDSDRRIMIPLSKAPGDSTWWRTPPSSNRHSTVPPTGTVASIGLNCTLLISITASGASGPAHPAVTAARTPQASIQRCRTGLRGCTIARSPCRPSTGAVCSGR